MVGSFKRGLSLSLSTIFRANDHVKNGWMVNALFLLCPFSSFLLLPLYSFHPFSNDFKRFPLSLSLSPFLSLCTWFS